MKWRSIATLKLQHRFRESHPPKMVLFSKRMNSFFIVTISFIFLTRFRKFVYDLECLENLMLHLQFLSKICSGIYLVSFKKFLGSNKVSYLRWRSWSISYGRTNGKSCCGWWWGLLLTLVIEYDFCQHWGLL